MCTKLPYPAGVPYNGTPSSPVTVPHLQQLPTARQPVDGEQCGRQQAHHQAASPSTAAMADEWQPPSETHPHFRSAATYLHLVRSSSSTHASITDRLPTSSSPSQIRWPRSQPTATIPSSIMLIMADRPRAEPITRRRQQKTPPPSARASSTHPLHPSVRPSDDLHPKLHTTGHHHQHGSPMPFRRPISPFSATDLQGPASIQFEQQQVLEDFSGPPAALARTTQELHQIAPLPNPLAPPTVASRPIQRSHEPGSPRSSRGLADHTCHLPAHPHDARSLIMIKFIYKWAAWESQEEGS